MPKVSIISIASSEESFVSIKQTLCRQTLQDYEFIGEIGKEGPKAWNRAIARSSGEILVFMEASATPVNERWLEELTAGVADEQTVAKGPEITSTPLDPSSLAGYRQAFIDQPFDENYLWSEDTELFCRLKEAGYRFVQLNVAPVIHLQKPGSKTFVRRAFRYGLYYAQIRHRYAEPVDVMGASMALKNIVKLLLSLLGIWVGSVIYWPERRSRDSGSLSNFGLGK